MTDTSDSFVQEISEELRKDQLTGYARKYGWIVVAVVLGVVGTTAYLEYERSQTEAAAKKKGELFLSALNDADPEARTAALGEIATRDEEAAALATFLHANGLLEADNEEAALNALDALATDATTDQVYRDLAALKALMIRGDSLDMAQRQSALDVLAAPGRPFRISALEQKAVALIDAGETEQAIEQFNALLQEPNVSQAQQARWQQVIVALGGEAQLPVQLGSGDQ